MSGSYSSSERQVPCWAGASYPGAVAAVGRTHLVRHEGSSDSRHERTCRSQLVVRAVGGMSVRSALVFLSGSTGGSGLRKSVATKRRVWS